MERMRVFTFKLTMDDEKNNQAINKLLVLIEEKEYKIKSFRTENKRIFIHYLSNESEEAFEKFQQTLTYEVEKIIGFRISGIPLSLIFFLFLIYASIYFFYVFTMAN